MTRLTLLVGLGNPGVRYAGTRHNVGFLVLDRLASGAGTSFRPQPRLQGDLADVGSGDQRLRLLKPTTFMNNSGQSVRASLDWFGWGPEQLLVIVDDMDLPLGRLRLRASGSAGGHNGLRSIIQHLGSDAFARLRIGIGAPGESPVERRERTVGHVLGRFTDGERPLLDQVLQEVVDGIDRIQRLGLERAGNRINAFRPEG
ncbi:MAG: aminoacyl-tRNA hydrolase [Prochlorococcaceae cyanobacterium]|jgi:PTH1 family peptidyl-tRNA hydrolase